MEYPKLFDLYQAENGEEVVPFIDGNGFSIIKKYQDSRLEKYFLMIKIFLTDQGDVAGSINIVEHKDDSILKGYVWPEPQELKVKVNNFFFNKKDFIFKQGNFYTPSGIKLTINDVIKNLEYNHVSKKVNLYQRFIKWLFETLVKIIFWFGDSAYSYKESLTARLTTDKYKETVKKKFVKEDPLFKYFSINKNVLFSFTILSLPVIFISCEFYDMDITRLPVVFVGLIALFILEKISTAINKQVEEVNLDESLVQRLIQKSQGQGFSLSIKHK